MPAKINKREAQLKSQLFEEIGTYGKTLEVTSIQDVRKPGTPDFTLSGHGKTCWWEMKHGTPNFTTYGLQEIKCCRLAITSFCRYVIYVERRINTTQTQRYVIIVNPAHVFGKSGRLIDIEFAPDYRIEGHDHSLVADYMRKQLYL